MTPEPASEWTHETLLLHLRDLMDERERRWQVEIDALAALVRDVQAVVNEQRLAIVALKDQVATLLTRAEYGTAHEYLVQRIAEVGGRVDSHLASSMAEEEGKAESRTSLRNAVLVAVALSTVLLGALELFLNHFGVG